MEEKIKITEQNIEEMCLLAEDVMQQLYMNYSSYDEEGNYIFKKYWGEDGSDYEKNKDAMHEEIRKLIETDESHLLYDLFRRGDDIGDVRYYTLKDIRPWIEPIIPKALKLFRKGTDDELDSTDYAAAESVPDEYLIALFAREVRNMMMIFAGQRMQEKEKKVKEGEGNT